MSVTFSAPYESSVVSTIIPNPSFDNTEAIKASMIKYRAVDGTLYAYPKKTNQYELVLTFTDIARLKILEVFEFIKAYHGVYFRFIDWNDNLWKASILEESISTETIAWHQGIEDLPEVGEFTLKLLASKQF